MSGRLRREKMLNLHRSEHLCAALRRAREQAKLSRAELAARSGVNASTIQKIEDGRSANPGVFTVAALAVALDLDISDVVRRRTGRLRTARLSSVEPKSDPDAR
ncbi:helix-turn-helix transcriptional regulator [Microbacterium sp. SORGH_AS_0421]|uniref:helix-turn-helix domain-containing protein n=2 Tax=unclassified Microbacterium TaxID=2609290 RepID=UPI001AE60FF4|nr:helix-turn-helix transcriptional regulator [Microbacterium sp. SORGH_AS_0421]MDQ1176327.1 transcriptional regulator with XRE-family HTH domain [Microbacterium sp. SORGH_AS_0421]